MHPLKSDNDQSRTNEDIEERVEQDITQEEEERSGILEKLSKFLGFESITAEKRFSLLLILVIVFFDLFGVGLVYPLIPFYAQQLGATKAEIGAIGSVYGILQLFGSLLVGKMSDKYGRKMVFFLSLASACFSYFSMTLAPSVLALFIFRIPIGLFKQTVTISTTIVADISPTEERARFIGYVGTAVGMGFIFGPTISAILAQYGIYYPVYLCTFLYLLGMYLLYAYFPSSTMQSVEEINNLPIEHDDDHPFIEVEDQKVDLKIDQGTERVEKKLSIYSLCTDTSEFLRVVLSSTVSYLLLVQFFSSLAELSFSATFQQFAFSRYSLTASENGYLMSYMSFLEVFTQGVVVGPLTRLRSESELITISIIIYSVSTFALGLLSTIPMVLIVLIPTLSSFRIFTTCLTSKISKCAPKSELGSIFGISGSLSSVCRAISPYIGAIIVQYFGSFAGTLLVSILAFALFLLLSIRPIA